jgi:hypothetical protein
LTSKTAYKNSDFYLFSRSTENRDSLTMAFLGRISQNLKIPHFYDSKFYFDSEFLMFTFLPSPKVEIPFWDFLHRHPSFSSTLFLSLFGQKRDRLFRFWTLVFCNSKDDFSWFWDSHFWLKFLKGGFETTFWLLSFL